MENLSIAQNLKNTQNEAYFLVKTTVQNYSGQQTEMITMFHRDIGWEEACIGIRKGLVHQDDVECCDIVVYVVKNGQQKQFAVFQREYFAEKRKEYLQKLLYAS